MFRSATVSIAAAIALAGFTSQVASATSSPTTWADLKSAFSAVSGSDTIILGSDISGTNDNLAVPDGASITLDLNGHNLTITSANGTTSVAPLAAIAVPAASTLTITGSSGGTLTVTGGNGATGSSSAHSGGAAGIGGNGGTSAGAPCGTVVVEAGTVTALGGSSGASGGAGAGGGGAGIGGGGGGTSIGGSGCSLTIRGGVISATGGNASSGGIAKGGGGAAIGGGGGGSSSGGSPSSGPAGGTAGTLSVFGSGTPVSTGSGANGTAAFPYTYGKAGVAPSPTSSPRTGAYFTHTASNGGTVSVGGTAALNYSFDVVFESSGGSTVSTQNVAYGGLATAPANPTYSGRTFRGWKLGTSSGSDYLFTSIVWQPTTLVALWESPTVQTSSPSSEPSAIGSPGLAATGVDVMPSMALVALLSAAGLLVLYARKARAHS